MMDADPKKPREEGTTTMSFHTDACRWEMIIVSVTSRSPRHETPFVVVASTCPDEAETAFHNWRCAGWEVTCTTTSVDAEGAEKLAARKAADELRLCAA